MKRLNKPRVLIISFSPLNSDPRVLRQIQSLQNKYDLIIAGYESSMVTGIKEIILTKKELNFFQRIRNVLLIIFGLSKIYYWFFIPEINEIYSKLKREEFDLIIVNDFDPLPLALKLAKKCPILLDSHEYTPGELPMNNIRLYPLKIFNKWLVNKHITKVRKISTVSSEIARLYYENFEIDSPIVLPNVPNYRNIQPRRVSENKIKLVHHGIVSNNRGLEILIETMNHVGKLFELHLILLGSSAAINGFKHMSKDKSNIFFHKSVSFDSIIPFLNQFDVGIFILPPKSANALFALPNKFFEFVQARLAVIIGPSPEMANYVNEYKFGLITKDFCVEDLTKQLMSLDSQTVWEFKEAAHNAAAELCWENYLPNFISAVEGSLNQN